VKLWQTGCRMENTLPKRALKPVAIVSKEVSVIAAVQSMVEKKVGAVVILDEGRVLGVFTERDVMTRVLIKRLDPEKTPIAEVMTRDVVTVREDTDRKVALELMTKSHIRHLPVLDKEGKVISMLSMRHLLRADVDDLRQTVWALVADMTIDARGG
jgi:CBS domain-containing protein